MKIWDNVIIGAGLSGLILARRLVESGREVLVIEKSKSVGGRMATRRDGDATFDHGAQHTSLFFAQYFNDGFWKPWFSSDGEIKFSVNQGINKVGKHLAQGLEIRLNEKVVNLKSDGHTTIYLESGDIVSARKIYLTCPVPQSVDLLKAAHISYPEILDQIQYAQALVGLFRLDSECEYIKNFTFAENVGLGIFSVSNQQSKGVSESLAFTVVMDPKFSENYFDKDDAGNLFLIENCFASFLMSKFNINEFDFTIIRSQLKKWKYSHPLNNLGVDYLALSEKNIFLIGDGFAGGSLAKTAASALAVPI